MEAGLSVVKGRFRGVFNVKHLARFAGRLKAARLAMFERFGEREWSQTDLAEAVGVERASVSGWERGEYEPAQPVKERLAGVLRVTPGWLLLGLEPRYPVKPLKITKEEGRPFQPTTKRRRASGEE